jgi:predicted RNA methylase
MDHTVPRRLRWWVVLGLLALLGVGVLAVASLPDLSLVHGTTAGEVERLAVWLEAQPGTRVADLGAGDGTFAIALARLDPVLTLMMDAVHLYEGIVNTTVSQNRISLGRSLATAGEARGVREEGASLESIQGGDGGGNMTFRPHRERPAA